MYGIMRVWSYVGMELCRYGVMWLWGIELLGLELLGLEL